MFLNKNSLITLIPAGGDLICADPIILKTERSIGEKSPE
ncbi:hypothetical protein OVS_04275 [Mycoplasma ovis str. Michigan]|uniref:Uncharacterized protein n=1 Tax=Mycoplasma ovis str. Michigan TaxID=1415773 RepID=A0ABN4BNT4_9MOLU|nr:hypothetical protein OVS_04275 [Mycoplasma ovis str. Michigan]